MYKTMTTITVPQEYNNLRVMTALETITANLDKFPVEELEDIVNRNQLINWDKRKN